MFDSAAAATIDVFLCRRTMTVIAAIASHEAGEGYPENVGTGAGLTYDDHDAAERHDARQHGSQMRDFPQPYPGQPGREERARRDDDGDIGYIRELQRRDEGDHRQCRKRRDQPAVDVDPDQIPQARAALQHYHQDHDQAAAEQSAPEQDGPGVVGQQPCEERRGAPGDGRGDDKGNAEAMLGANFRHQAINPDCG
jgi:hypothetical protein